MMEFPKKLCNEFLLRAPWKSKEGSEWMGDPSIVDRKGRLQRQKLIH